MSPYIAFYLGATLGFCLGFLMAAILTISARGEQDLEAFELAKETEERRTAHEPSQPLSH